MAKSFLERIQPSRQRWKMVEWPFPVEGERPQVRLRVLGQDEVEQAYLATCDHFKGIKRKVEVGDVAFAAREHAEIVWRAYSIDGDPLAADAAEMAKQPKTVLDVLYATYSQFHADVAAMPHTAEDMDGLVDLLKKNMDADLLSALPSSWLIELVRTLASQLVSSTPANERG